MIAWLLRFLAWAAIITALLKLWQLYDLWQYRRWMRRMYGGDAAAGGRP